MFTINFSTEANRESYAATVLSWLKQDFNDKKGPQNHFWHNRSLIKEAFDDHRGLVIHSQENQFVGYMVWHFDGDQVAEIDIVEVVTAFRRQGALKQMLSTFSSHYPHISVLSGAVLPQARETFTHMGWKQITYDAKFLYGTHDRTFYKALKNPAAVINTLPEGFAIAICSEGFYQVQKNRENYSDKTYYLSPTIESDGKLTPEVVVPCHRDGYLGFYFNQKLIHESKPKALEDMVFSHSGIMLINHLNTTLLSLCSQNDTEENKLSDTEQHSSSQKCKVRRTAGMFDVTSGANIAEETNVSEGALTSNEKTDGTVEISQFTPGKN